MTAEAPFPTEAVASFMAALPSRSHQRAFHAVLDAVLRRRLPGICITGGDDAGRAALLQGLAALPSGRVRMLWLPPAAAPADLNRCLAEAEPDRAAGTPRVVLVIPGADTLRRDTLDALDDLARTLEGDPRNLQMLVAGEHAFLTRLQITRKPHLMSYLSKRLALTSPPPAPLLPPTGRAEVPAPMAAIPPATTRSPRQTSITLAFVLAVAVAVGAGYLLYGDDPAVTEDGRTGPALSGTPPPHVTPVPAPESPSPEQVRPEQAPPEQPGPEQPLAGPLDRPPEGPERRPAPDAGLIIVARPGDSLAGLYRRIYAGLEPPPFEQIVAANPNPLKPGMRVMFPRPPAGWDKAAPSGMPDTAPGIP